MSVAPTARIRQRAAGNSSLRLIGVGLSGAALGVATASSPVVAGLAIGLLGLVAVGLYSRLGWAAVVLILLATVPIVIGLTVGVAETDAPRYAGAVDEVSLLAGWALFIACWSSLDRGVRAVGALAIGLFFLSELFGYLSTPGDLSLRVSAAWQDLRWLGVVGWGIVIGRRVGQRRAMKVALGLLLTWATVNLLVVLQQIASGDVGDAGSRFLGIPATDGAFGHPTGGALVGTALLLLVGVDRVRPYELRFLKTREAWLAAALGLSIVVLSTRFKPLLGFAGAAIVIATFLWARSAVLAAVVVPVIVGATTLIIAVSGPVGSATNVDPEGRNFLEVSTATAPTRLALIRGADVLARDGAPFGRGLGTYGSDLSPDEEQRAFNRAGLGGTYGFTYGTSQYRQDSYVGHVLGERGYFGFVFWIAALAAAMLTAIRWHREDLYPACAFVLMVVTATVGPSLHSAQYSMLVLLPAAILLGPRRSTAEVRAL